MPKRKNAKPDSAATGRASKKNTQPSQFNAKSARSEAQRQRIVEALRRRPQTSYDLRRIGCYQAPARVKELRDRFGFVIQTSRVTLVDRDGYPRQATFVKQANIAQGPQQVNNGAPAGIAHAEQTQPQQNELLEQSHANIITPRLDTGAAQTPERSHPAVGTVESVHRAKKPRG